MSTLDQLKAQHLQWCFMCGRMDSPPAEHFCDDGTSRYALHRALIAKAQEDEARIKMLEQARDDWKSRHDCLDRQGFKVSRELDAERSARQALEAKLEEADKVVIHLYDCWPGDQSDLNYTAWPVCQAALSRRAARGHETE